MGVKSESADVDSTTGRLLGAAHGYAVRVKLFVAFALTALWSLYSPGETKQMIDDWVAANRKRTRAKLIARMFNRPHTDPS